MKTIQNINQELVDTVMAKHWQYDWNSHALQVVRGCYMTWTDCNGISHRIDGFSKANLLERIKAL
jgi:hypothetical protein